MESAFSEDNQQIQHLTTAHLNLLDTLSTTSDQAINNQTQGALETLERSIADPGLRALLELKRQTALPKAR